MQAKLAEEPRDVDMKRMREDTSDSEVRGCILCMGVDLTAHLRSRQLPLLLPRSRTPPEPRPWILELQQRASMGRPPCPPGHD